MATKIIQIIPATEWYARYEEEGTSFLEPIACWALIDRGEDGTEIDGLVPAGNTLVPCKETDGFAEIINREKV
ncbi:MAG: hypothetical protein L3J03_03355 [Desulfobacterales bacterium]|nr:hypothetical protein [Desulfobacterales bacterium]